MYDFLTRLFDSTGFMPRRSCGTWSTGLVLLHNSSDVLIAVSYFAIPAILFYFLRQRRDLPFRPVFWLFGAFIFACGLTHLLEIVVFYAPLYRLVGAAKLATGLVSAATSAALVGIIPRALALRGPSMLERELEERRQSEKAAGARARQLELLVELSGRALAADDPDVLAAEIPTLVARGLVVDFCGVLRATPDATKLQLVAGVGWRDGVIGTATVLADVEAMADFVAQEAGLAVGPDREDNGRRRPTLLDGGDDAIGGLSIAIPDQDGVHGVLIAFVTRPRPFGLIAFGRGRPFGDDEVWFLRSVAALFGSNLGRIEAEQTLKCLANTDCLTGLHNTRHLREALPAMISHASRVGGRLSVVMIDIDRFKSYNDAFGHPGGDDVLRDVGAILRREACVHDLVARYGGEEFAVVLPGVDTTEVIAFAERVRKAIYDHPWPLRSVTASLGTATGAPGGSSGLDLLAEADQALYLAKRTGRDRVVHYDDLRCDVSLRDGPQTLSPDREPGEAAPPGSVLLHIDDNRSFRRAIERYLVAADLGVIGVDTATEGLQFAADGPDLILLDVRLPDGDGLDVCRRLKADPVTAMIPILLLSGTIVRGDDRARALAAGAAAALAKSSEPGELLAVVSALLRARQSERELIRARHSMEERLRVQGVEFERLCDTTIEGWARALELRDHETEGHSRRVTELTEKIGRRMGLDNSALVHMRRGALLHDIGKVGVPDAILNKPSPLDTEEWRVMRRHPELGYQLLRPIEFLQPSLEIPHRHHERWDGSGYPDGLRGDDIPLTARIFAAADIYDALSHDRPYRKAWGLERVKDYIQSLAGSHLDPAVAVAFLKVV